MALLTAAALAWTFSLNPSVERIWPLVLAAVDYLAGFTIAAALRLAIQPLRPTSLKGLALPAIGYGLAIFIVTWLPIAMTGSNGHADLIRPIAIVTSAILAALTASASWRGDLRIDPPVAEQASTEPSEDHA